MCLATKVPTTEPNTALINTRRMIVRQMAQYGMTPSNRRCPQRRLVGLFSSDTPAARAAAWLMAPLLVSDVKLLNEWRESGESGSSMASNSGSLVAKPMPPAPGIGCGMAREEDVVVAAGAVAAPVVLVGAAVAVVVDVAAVVSPEDAGGAPGVAVVAVDCSTELSLAAYGSSGYLV